MRFLMVPCFVVVTLLGAMQGVSHAACKVGSVGWDALRIPPPACASPLRVVLIAGDQSDTVFDNATRAVTAALVRRGVSEPDITRLSADPAKTGKGVRTATAAMIRSTIASMHPSPGQGCLVYATSHGVKGEGLYLSSLDEVLTPGELDTALRQGCGEASTVVVISACYSGQFSQPPMTKPNRVILTAARADRPSFGCGAGLRYTYYDDCLLQALQDHSAWPAISGSVRACVGARERKDAYPSSMPQAYFGQGARGMVLPGG